MGIQLFGQDGEILQIDAKHRALRASLRPLDVGANGAFRVSAVSGSIGATLAANSPLFSMRWTDSSKKLVLTELQISALVNGTITTAVPLAFEAVVARGFSASDTGGTAISVTGNNQKMETGHASSLVADMRIATTGTLTAGTRTLDTQGIGHAAGASGTTAGTIVNLPLTPLLLPKPGLDHPLVLAQNEGLVIRNMVTGPATGTFQLFVTMGWSEVASFNNVEL